MDRTICLLAAIPVGIVAYFVAYWLPLGVAFLTTAIAGLVIEALLGRNRP